MTAEELNLLAHEIAEEDCKSLIECSTLVASDTDGHSWYDLGSVHEDEPAKAAVDRAVTFLDAAEILKRSKSNPQLVGWDEDGLDD